MEKSGFAIDQPIAVSSTKSILDIEDTLRVYDMTSFRLVNFKAFHDTGWIKVNRLTLLLGENSSGKSALYQALQMVAYSYNRMMQEDRFTNLSRIAEEIGNFEDICNKSAKNPVVEIGFRFLHEEKILEYCVYIGRSENNEFGRVIKVQGRTGNQSWDLLKYYESTNIFFLKRRKLEIPKEIEELAGCVLASLRQFAQSFQVLTAHRYRPERFLQLTGGEYENVGMTGANTYDMLFSLSEIHGKKASLVEEWLSRFGYTYRWKMSGVNRGEFMLQEIKSGMESNLVDNGFGISQSLPLALALETLKKGEIILVDSPEAFLQTKMQSEMGDLLVEGSRNGKVLLETGSEYLTLRIRRRVAEGLLSKDEVSVYFLEDISEGNTVCVPLEIDDNGEFRNTSKQFRQFFSSDFIDIEKMDEIRRKKYADKNCN